MRKCDLCPDSYLQNGKLVCPYGMCLLRPSELKKIYDIIANVKK